MKRWSAGFLSLVMSGALVLAGCTRDTSRRQNVAGLAGDADQDEPTTQAVMSAWVYPDGYTDQDLIALANEHGGYGSIYSAAVNAGYINDPASSSDGSDEGPSSGDDGNNGGTWGGDDDGGGGNDNPDGGGGNDQPDGGEDPSGGTWGDDGGGGTWGDDGGGTWGGTWGDDGSGGGWASTGFADEYEPDEGITHRDATLAARMTPYAVTAGIVSQADTPAPGPADLVALGILAYGLFMSSGSQAPAKPCDPCPAPDPPQVHHDHSHGNCPGAHWHYFRYNQNPNTCVCYNQRMFGGCCGEGDPDAPC